MDARSTTKAYQLHHYCLQFDADIPQFNDSECGTFIWRIYTLNRIYVLKRILLNKWSCFSLHPQINIYVFVFKTNFSFRCEPCNFATDLKGMFAVYLTYFYFIIKLTALFDTVFFTLSKRWAHVSFLDVYQHLMVSISAYVYALYAPGLKIFSMSFNFNIGLLGIVVNSFFSIVRSWWKMRWIGRMMEGLTIILSIQFFQMNSESCLHFDTRRHFLGKVGKCENWGGSAKNLFKKGGLCPCDFIIDKTRRQNERGSVDS